MSDDDEPMAHHGQAMLYDYLKHLTTLCLFSLGGVAALADKVSGRQAILVVMAMVVIGLAAFSAFIASGMIVDARYTRQPIKPHFDRYRHAAPPLLSGGLGMFMYLFFGSLRT